jgi:hypothetical protein
MFLGSSQGTGQHAAEMAKVAETILSQEGPMQNVDTTRKLLMHAAASFSLLHYEEGTYEQARAHSVEYINLWRQHRDDVNSGARQGGEGYLEINVRVFLSLGELSLADDSSVGDAYELYSTVVVQESHKANPVAWLGLARVYLGMRQGSLDEAEACLSCASVLDNKNCHVWGYMALVLLQRAAYADNQTEEDVAIQVGDAKSAFFVALQCGLDDQYLLRDLGQLFTELGDAEVGTAAEQRALAFEQQEEEEGEEEAQERQQEAAAAEAELVE